MRRDEVYSDTCIVADVHESKLAGRWRTSILAVVLGLLVALSALAYYNYRRDMRGRQYPRRFRQ
jgi:hypothetical protein